MAWLSIIFAAIPAVIYLAAGLPVIAGTVSIGTLIAFTTLQNGLFRPITGLLSTSVSVISLLALFARIFGYLDLPVEVDEPALPVSIDPAQVTWHVRVEDVSFTYPGADRPALAGINLDVPAGTTLALVGETGSGKTTLAAPPSPSRTACPPSATPARSPCSTTAASSRPATTPACSPARAATPELAA
jgi:ATP-binding cassette, subfamily B, bacterial